MTSPQDIVEVLLDRILAAPQKGRRKLVALAGPPASGKTTLARVLADQLTHAGCATKAVPMDGFHLDNCLLKPMGLLPRKGAPDTFDAGGILRLVQALSDVDRAFYPTFDRDQDFARAGAGMIDSECECVVVEGNYLLFDAPTWRDLHPLWDISISLNVQPDILKQRLVQRWIDFGMPRNQAEQRALGNDMVNAQTIAKHALPATITI
jgi:pantothenate kinase